MKIEIRAAIPPETETWHVHISEWRDIGLKPPYSSLIQAIIRMVRLGRRLS